MSKPSRNVSPYYDDFDESKRFTKILFNPGRAIQAREMTQMQSLLQNQIERAASYFVQNGDYIVPGELTFTLNAKYAKLSSTDFESAINVSSNAVFTGTTTGVIGRVITVNEATLGDPYTVYLNYLNSGNNVKLRMVGGDYSENVGNVVAGATSTATGSIVSWDSSSKDLVLKRNLGNDTEFSVGESVANVALSITASTISAITDYNKIRAAFLPGETIVSGNSSAVVDTSDTAIGNSAIASIDAGIYFVDGLFANVEAQTLVIGKYTNSPSCRVGLSISHDVVTYGDDVSLLDPSQGASNYQAPGADRNRTTLTLSQLSLTDLSESTDFIELLRLNSGQVDSQVKFRDSPVLEHTLADRTYDESGNYTVWPFGIDVREHASSQTDVHGNPGVFTPGDADDLAVGMVAGKAYVHGFEYETKGTKYVKVDKARDYYVETGSYTQEGEMGNYILATGVFSLPKINSGEYDVQNYPVVDIFNDAINTFAGMNFTFATVTSANKVVLSDKMWGSGEDAYTGGKILINGPVQKESATIEKYYDSNNTCILAEGGLPSADATSLYDLVGPTPTQERLKIGTARIRDIVLDPDYSGNEHGLTGIYRIYLFDINMKSEKNFDLARSFGMRQGEGEPSYFSGNILTELSVESFNGRNFTRWNWAPGTKAQIEANVRTFRWIKAIKGDGTGTIVVGNVFNWNPSTKKLLVQNLTSAGRDEFNPVVARQFASNFDVGDKIYEMQFDSDWAWVEAGPYGEVGSKQKFWKTDNKTLLFSLPYQAIKGIDRVVLTHTRKTFSGKLSGDSISFYLMNPNESFADVNDTNYIVAVNGRNGNFGIRDDLTSATLRIVGGDLQVTIPGGKTGDLITILGTVRKDPAARKTKILSGPVSEDFLTRDAVQKDGIQLQQTDIYSLDSVQMAKNGNFGDSSFNVTAVIDITGRYDLDTGQRDNFYDRGYIRLKAGERRPAKPIRVSYKYFEHGQGDYFSVQSYPLSQISYGSIPKYVSPITGKEWRLSDCYDFRPKKDVDGTFLKSRGSVLIDLPAVGGSFIAEGYQYYLNRIDKIYIDVEGNFIDIKGAPAVNPVQPPDPNNGMVLYMLNIRAYTYDTNDVIPVFVDNRRYTMRDIGSIEKRVERLEYYTTLNLLEKETADLAITDALGIERFKNGFVVDTFSGHGVGDTLNKDYACSIDGIRGELRPQFSEKAVEAKLSASLTSGTEGTDYANSNGLITLAYSNAIMISHEIGNRWRPINTASSHKWRGAVTLDPPNDFWKSTKLRPALLVNDEGDYDSLRNAPEEESYMLGSLWDEWRQNWFGVPVKEVSNKSMRPELRWNSVSREIIPITETKVTTGVSSQKVTNLLSAIVGNRLITVAFVPFQRKRDISFSAIGMKPDTRVYPFYEGVNVSSRVQQTGGALGGGLFTNTLGAVSGTFVYDPDNTTVKFKAGMNKFKLTDSFYDADELATTIAETQYYVTGILPCNEGSITSTRAPEIVTEKTTRNISGMVADDQGDWINPLAQTFVVPNKNGAYVTKVDLYFRNKPKWNGVWYPVIVEIRDTENGKPGKHVIPFARTHQYNESIIQEDWLGLTPTTFTFPAPVFLQEGKEYALVVRANHPDYNLWTGKIGYPGFITTSQVVSKTPYFGTLFGAENTIAGNTGQTDEMLKCTIHRASFDITKTPELIFTNRSLPIEYLPAQPMYTTEGSTKVRVTHKNHGLFPTSLVTIAGVDTDQNGIPAAEFNGTFTVLDLDLDSYLIDVGGTDKADTTGTANAAVSSGFATATGQARMDAGYFFAQQIIASGTNISWSIRPFRSNYLPGKTNYDDIVINETTELPTTHVIAASPNAAISLNMKARLESSSENLSPAIDSKRLGVIAISNRIDSTNPIEPDYEVDTEVKIDSSLYLHSNTISFKGDTTAVYDNVWFLKHFTINAAKNDSYAWNINAEATADELVHDTKLYQPYNESFGYVYRHETSNNSIMVYGIKGDFTKDHTIFAGDVNGVVDGSGIGVDANGDPINVIFTINATPTVELAWIANLGDENFRERYDIGDRLNITSSGLVKNELIEAVVEQMAEAGNNILTTYGTGSHAGDFYTALQGESGDTTIINIDGLNRIYSDNAETQALLSTIEPNKYIQITGSANPAYNDGVFRVINVDDSGNVVVDGSLTYEYSDGTKAIGIIQRDNFIADYAPRGGSSKAVYVTRQISLDSPADAIRVILSAEMPADTVVSVFYKTLPANSSKSFDDIPYVGFNYTGLPDSMPTYEKGVYKEYEYNATGLGSFTQFVVKIVMKSSNSASVPKIRDMRAIATSL